MDIEQMIRELRYLEKKYKEVMSRSKVFDSNYDFMINYSAAMLGANRGRWTVFLKNKTTSLVEAFRVPMSEKGGLFNIEEQRLISWEELAANYTFIDDTPCVGS